MQRKELKVIIESDTHNTYNAKFIIKRDNNGNPVYKPINFCFGSSSVYIYTGNTNETRKNTYSFEKYYEYLTSAYYHSKKDITNLTRNAIIKDIVKRILLIIKETYIEYYDGLDMESKINFWQDEQLEKAFRSEINKMVQNYIFYGRMKTNEKRFYVHLMELAYNKDINATIKEYENSTYYRDFVKNEFINNDSNIKYFVVPINGDYWSNDMKNYILVQASGCFNYKEVIDKVYKEISSNSSDQFKKFKNRDKNPHFLDLPTIENCPKI